MKLAKRFSLRSKRTDQVGEEAIIPCELSLELEQYQLASVPSALSESESSDLILDPIDLCRYYYPTIVPVRARIMATGTLSASGDGTVEHLFPSTDPTNTFSSSSSSPKKSTSRSPSSSSSSSSSSTTTFCCTEESSSNLEHADADLNGSTISNLLETPTTTPTSPSSLLTSQCLNPKQLPQPSSSSTIVFKRTNSSFLRVADLEMDETVSLARSSSTLSSDTTATITGNAENNVEESFPNYHHISVDPPPGIAVDPKERWVVLDNGHGVHAPLAPMAVRALVKSGMTSMYDESMWIAADAKTTKFIKQKPNAWPSVCTWQRHGGVVQLPITSTSAVDEQEVMVWSGSFKHGLYGSELPAIRSAGIIGMSPQALMELLVDSNRIKEYNKLSLGRTDLLILQGDMSKDGPFGGVTKIMKAVTKPPLVRKALVFTSLIHVRELDDGSGYKIVTRAVTPPDENASLDEHDNASCNSGGGGGGLANALQSEILLGVNIIKRIEGDENRCLMMCVNHIRSPMVPMMIAKRIGLQAAQNFYHDLRACC